MKEDLEFDRALVNAGWMINMDLDQIIEIDRRCFDSNWDKSDFKFELRNRSVIPIVAFGENRRIYGYCLYILMRSGLLIARMAVDPDKMRQGVGSFLIDVLKRKISDNKTRDSIVTYSPESNLEFQLFLRSQKFKATGIESLDSSDVEYYRFEYR
jgi:ribosomal protein S18 acetylase RimI-like enzyme